MNRRNHDYFWLSYADLMTSLFFIMLVLFVLVFSIMQYKTTTLKNRITALEQKSKSLEVELEESKKNQEELQSKNKKLLINVMELKKIRSIKETLKALENGGNFTYNPYCKRFELKQQIMFAQNSAVIPSSQTEMLKQAGKELIYLINSFSSETNIKFLIIIEGRAAKHENAKLNLRYANNVKDLSYSRSLALYTLWKKNGINLNSKNSEIMIAGSGFEGLCRYTGINEWKNKRVIIQVIPYLIK